MSLEARFLAGRIARVFPRRTNATPTDRLAFTDGPGLFPPDVDEVHVSISFSWDLEAGWRLARNWERVAPVKVGGPALGDPGDEFIPGLYVRPGYVITSRGCPNRCWFCKVWRREGDVRELRIREGKNVLDDNLLACSRDHVERVFDMLENQRGEIVFTGGLEAARLRPWIVERLARLKPREIFFAYDTADDLSPLRAAGEMLREAGFSRGAHRLRCFVLVGYPKDSFKLAEDRLREAFAAGFLPMAMLYRDDDGRRDPAWIHFQRLWARPHVLGSRLNPSAASRPTLRFEEG